MKSSCLWALLCAALAPPAIADTTFKVGLGAGCTHSTIQSALDAAANDGNQPSLILLTRSLSYTNQALRINDPESVELRGGFERCSDAEASGGYTRIDGAGGTAQSVIAVVGSYRSRVRLAALEITGGDAENHEYGGGVYARHGGILAIVASSIHGNRAGYGGGVAIDGNGTVLQLGDDVLIYSNSAYSEGGGGYCRQGAVQLRAQGSGFLDNNALGEGGGLRLNQCDADLAGNGPLNAGVLYGNTAYHGAGLSVSNAKVRIYSLWAQTPNRIAYNRATSNGGGLLVRNAASVTLWDTLIEGNSANRGAAGYAYNDTVADPRIRLRSARNRDAGTPAAAVPCVSGTQCNRVTGNIARASGTGPGEGAAFYFDWSSPTGCNFPFSCFWPEGFVAEADLLDAQLDRNSGNSLIYFRQHYDHYAIAQSLIVANSVTDALIKTGDDDTVWISQTTISGNTVSGPLVRSPHLDLRCAIVNQTGVIHQGSGTRNAQFVLVPNTTQLPSSTSVFQGVPRFIGPASDNYRLYAGGERFDPIPSIGIDIASACGPFQQVGDLDGLSRPVDIQAAANQFGTIDLGPYEARPTLISF